MSTAHLFSVRERDMLTAPAPTAEAFTASASISDSKRTNNMHYSGIDYFETIPTQKPPLPKGRLFLL
jgi:hypothetical protein